MTRLALTPQVVRARTGWRYTGQVRPPFAVEPGPGQESVWDFPRPPRIEPVTMSLRVETDGVVVAATTAGYRVLETAGAPTYYFPPDDVETGLLAATGQSFHCEWKGISEAFAIGSVAEAGWVLRSVYPEFEILDGYYAFYPRELECFVGAERVSPQPGGYYGGWVTRNLAGPIKGAPQSAGW